MAKKKRGAKKTLKTVGGQIYESKGKFSGKKVQKQLKKGESPIAIRGKVYIPKKPNTQKKSMKEIIEELRKPPKPSGKTYINGIIKEQNKYKKIEQKEQKRLDKSRKKTLFKKPRYKKYAKIVSFENPSKALESARKLNVEYRESKRKSKKLRVLKVSRLARNCANAIKKRETLSPKKHQEMNKTEEIYSKLTNSLSNKYKKEK